MLALKAQQANVRLTGPSDRVDDCQPTVEKAMEMGLVSKDHKVRYLSPFTAGQPVEQQSLMQQTGLNSASVVDLDLEWGGGTLSQSHQKSQSGDLRRVFVRVVLRDRYGAVAPVPVPGCERRLHALAWALPD